MIKFAILKVQELNDREGIGCRFITLDAIRNSDPSLDSIHFYKKMGFNVLREREKGTTPMFKDLYHTM
jgi:hypothetical protein